MENQEEYESANTSFAHVPNESKIHNDCSLAGDLNDISAQLGKLESQQPHDGSSSMGDS